MSTTQSGVDASGVARSYLAAFGTGDPEAVASHVAPDFVNDHASALGAGCVGADEYRVRLPKFLASLPGLNYEVQSTTAEGARVAAAYRLTAQPGGHDIDVRGVMLIDVDPVSGLITRRTDYWDALTFLRQTGAAPA